MARDVRRPTAVSRVSSLHLILMADKKIDPSDVAMMTLFESGTDVAKCSHACRQCGELAGNVPEDPEVLCPQCRCSEWIKLTAPEGGYACQDCGAVNTSYPTPVKKPSCPGCGSSDWVKLSAPAITVLNR